MSFKSIPKISLYRHQQKWMREKVKVEMFKWRRQWQLQFRHHRRCLRHHLSHQRNLSSHLINLPMHIQTISVNHRLNNDTIIVKPHLRRLGTFPLMLPHIMILVGAVTCAKQQWMHFQRNLARKRPDCYPKIILHRGTILANSQIVALGAE